MFLFLRTKRQRALLLLLLITLIVARGKLISRPEKSSLLKIIAFVKIFSTFYIKNINKMY